VIFLLMGFQSRNFYLEKKGREESWRLWAQTAVEKDNHKKLKEIKMVIYRKGEEFLLNAREGEIYEERICFEEGEINFWEGLVLKGEKFVFQEEPGWLVLDGPFFIKGEGWKLKGKRGEIDLENKIVYVREGAEWYKVDD